MTSPRRLRPHQLHAITRRTSEQRMFLKPSKRVNAIVSYCLAYAQSRFPAVRVYAITVLSTHYHVVVSDGGGVSSLPGFFGLFNGLVARALNAEYRRRESVWAPGSYRNVEIMEGDRAALEEQLLYAWANAVKDGLVERPDEWTGFRTLPEDCGRSWTVERPEGAFFGGRQGAGGPEESRTAMPETLTLEISCPPGFEGARAEEGRWFFRGLLNVYVAGVREELVSKGRGKVLGVEAVESVDPMSARAPAPPSFQLNPRLAGHGIAFARAVRGLKVWRIAYGEALGRWRSGDRAGACFPRGSYWLPFFHGARVSLA